MPAYAANRAMPAAMCQPVSSGASSNDAISSSDASQPAPTTNVNAPLTGWLSADTTFHATTYVPSPRSSRSPTVTISPSACASSLSTRSPSVLSTRTPPSSSDTSSVKRSVTTSGAGSTCAPSAGVDVTNCAWADAGAASATRATTLTNSAVNPSRSRLIARALAAGLREQVHRGVELLGRQLTGRPRDDVAVSVHQHEVRVRRQAERVRRSRSPRSRRGSGSASCTRRATPTAGSSARRPTCRSRSS